MSETNVQLDALVVKYLEQHHAKLAKKAIKALKSKVEDAEALDFDLSTAVAGYQESLKVSHEKEMTCSIV
eukprot:m.9391 g.9391  ORF g.9391 m.9391 type:complete len:70 (-) comp9414_c0_seq2:111-320(-)